MEKRSWFDAEYVAQRQAEYEAKVRREEWASRSKERVVARVKSVFKVRKVKVA